MWLVIVLPRLIELQLVIETMTDAHVYKLSLVNSLVNIFALHFGRVLI